MFVSVLLALPLGLAPMVAAADPCSPDMNKIVCENSKPGAHWSEWEIDGAGDDSIQGFATDISVNAGARIDFKVDTDAADYDIDIYRTGWYQGLGARKIASLEPSASLPQVQPECLTDMTTELVDCGTWAVSASWDVPADAVSGVYVAKLTRADDGGASHITFIVRNDGSTSQVLFQTSDTTWHAYNNYGGSNFYQGADNGRAYKISYNRPFATRGGIEARDFYFGAEYPLVRFMERNGYDVSYFSGVDTHRYGDQLTNHEAFLSVGHDEYWSGQQRKNVEAARDAGVDLQFLSGNEMYWRVRYEQSPADPAGNDHRTLVSYKETWSHQKIDPSTEWTGTFRDPRFASVEDGGGVPENALTGTAYVVNYGDMPVTVDDREGDLSLWRDTGLEDLPDGATEELAPHTVGYESNEDLLNGFRPPGLIRLSTTTGPVPEYLQDFGTQVTAGTTTHHVTLYRAASGALVFSAGSVQWTWGLDEWHDGNGAPEDPRMQQAQVNLFADMGVQPTTLMEGLVPAEASSDTTPPTVEVTESPTGPVPHGELVTISGTATDGTGPQAGVVAGVEYSLDAGASWLLAEGDENWTFDYVQPGAGEHTVLVRAIDDSANYPAQGTAITHQVQGPYSAFGSIEPRVEDTGDTSAVELGLRFSPTMDGVITGVRFYRSEANTGPHRGTLWGLDGNQLATANFPSTTETGWHTTEFSEPVEVQAGADYVVSYSAPSGRYAADPYSFAYRGVNGPPVSVAGGYGVPDVGVYGGAGSYPSSSFHNANYYVDALFVPADELPLTAGSQQPANTAVSVPVTTPIGATLSREVDPASVALTVTVGEGGVGGSGEGTGTTVTGAVDYDPATRRVSFTPEELLAEGTRFTVKVSATDAAGDSVETGGTWGFRTWSDQPAGDCPCGLLPETILPTVHSIDDGRPVTLGTAFSTTEPGVATGLEFYKSAGSTGGQTGALYAADGTRLAAVDFGTGSVSGWQHAALDAPVHLEPGTEYVVAYTTRQYSTIAGHWSGPLSSGALRTDANAGRYSYTEPFPDAPAGTNYMVDIRFTPDETEPRIVERSPAAGAVDAAPDAPVTAVFGHAVHAEATLSVTRGDQAVAGAVTRSQDGRRLVFTPAFPLPAGAVVTVTASGVSAAGSAPDTPDEAWTYRVADPDASLLTFLGEREPSTLASGDSSAVELGVQLSTDQDITVHGLRYYRGTEPGVSGIGKLWGADGQVLAQVRFADPLDDGWQTAILDSPVRLTAGTTFTVSRFAPDGGYTYTTGGFAAPLSSGGLSLAGGNGRFAYGTGDTVPEQTWGATNYFVDLVYTQDHVQQAPLSAGDRQPADTAVSVPVTTPIGATLSRDVDPGSVSLELAIGEDGRGGSGEGAGTRVPGAVDYDAATRRVSFTPEAPLAAKTRFTVTLAAEDTSGEPLGDGARWNFTTWSDAPAGECPCGLLPETMLPTVELIDDGRPVTLGTAFTTTEPGVVTGLEFYKSAGASGGQTGALYTADGTRLAEVQFGGGTASGWQQAALDSPVRLETGTEYLMAYTTDQYSTVTGHWSGPQVSGPLRTDATAGRFSYTQPFPDQRASTNYLVDLRFTPDQSAPQVVERSPVPGTIDADPASTVSVRFDQPIHADAALGLRSDGSAVPGEQTRSADGTRLTFTPAEPLPAGALVSATVTGASAAGSTATVPAVEWTFRVADGAVALESFLGDAEPTTLSGGDSSAVELGVQLSTDRDITVHALRYFRGTDPGASGTGTVWDAQGVAVGTVTFGPPTGTGWQTAVLDAPVQFTAGSTFTVSRHAPEGGYAYTSGGFAASASRGALSLSGDNGRFIYGPGGLVPDRSWGSTNYFVDPLYSVD
jgi:hypothetical protein